MQFTSDSVEKNEVTNQEVVICCNKLLFEHKLAFCSNHVV